MQRVWFIIVSAITVIFALTMKPTAAPAFSNNAQAGDYIQGADRLREERTAPISLTWRDSDYFPEQDQDITQPEDYVPHTYPEDATDDTLGIPIEVPPTDPPPFGEPMTDPIEPIEIPPDPVETFATPTDPSAPVDIPADPSEPTELPTYPSVPTYPSAPILTPTEPNSFNPLEIATPTDADAALTDIKTGIYMILMCFVLCVAGGITFLICRMVWPLFRGWW